MVTEAFISMDIIKLQHVKYPILLSHIYNRNVTPSSHCIIRLLLQIDIVNIEVLQLHKILTPDK